MFTQGLRRVWPLASQTTLLFLLIIITISYVAFVNPLVRASVRLANNKRRGLFYSIFSVLPSFWKGKKGKENYVIKIANNIQNLHFLSFSGGVEDTINGGWIMLYLISIFWYTEICLVLSLTRKPNTHTDKFQLTLSKPPPPSTHLTLT